MTSRTRVRVDPEDRSAPTTVGVDRLLCAVARPASRAEGPEGVGPESVSG